MRILVHGLVGTNLGGIETFLLNMNDAMSDNCIFDYVIEEESCIHTARIEKKGGHIYKIASRHSHPARYMRDIINLYKSVKRTYETIYYNLSSASWIYPILVAKRMGYRVVVHSHNAALIDANNKRIYKIFNAVNRYMLGRMHIERLTCSQLASTFLFGRSDATLVYNGIDVKKYVFSEEKRKTIREKYCLNNLFVIGCVGRLAYQKNPLFTLDIFQKIYARDDRARLLMIGEGNMRLEIEKYIQNHHLEQKVILMGNISNVSEILNVMDVFLLPSRHEGLGIVLIEAQANGLHVFTSADTVPWEAQVTKQLHFLPLEETADYWADCILNVPREDGKVRHSLGQQVLESEYEIRKSARILERVLGNNLA
ncbi:MAG: glycosyltransferase [Clostridiaceae bacterium]|nr:glycosyltransferase [Clostridiaceae bacterium]